MDWSKGYSASLYMTIVDPATWRDVETARITGGSIKRESDGLRESADIEAVDFRIPVEQWVRVYMDVEQSGDNAHEALFTGLASTPDETFDGSIPDNKLECYSVLKPVDDVPLQRGWYAAAGRSGGDVIRDLLSVTAAPVVVDADSPALSTHIIAEDNETRLSMTDKILSAIDWRLRITGDGTIRVAPKATVPSVTFGPGFDCVEPEVKIRLDLYSCPNVLMAISDDMSSVARDESNGPLSIQGRGREVWAVETSVDLASNESLGTYANRRIKELQNVAKEASYSRAYNPGVVPGDLVRMQYNKLSGLYTVASQSISIEDYGRTSEEATEVIYEQT